MDEELKVKITVDATDANAVIDRLNKTLKYLRENTRIKVKFNYDAGRITGIKNINDFAPKWQEMYKQTVANIQEGAGLQKITEFLSQIAESTKDTVSAISEAPDLGTMSTEDLQTELERVNNDIAEYDRKIKNTEDSLEKLRNATRDCSLAIKKHENRLEALNKDRDVSVEWKDKIEKILGEREKQEETKESIGNSLKTVGLAMIGVRSVFALIRRIVNQNENLTTAIDNLLASIAGALKPVLDFIATFINTIAVILGDIFKINKKTSASTSTVAKTLASFDEINNIGGASSAGTGTDDKVNPGVFQWLLDLVAKIKEELGQWLVIIGAVALIIGAALNAVPLAIAGIIALIAGVWVLIKENWGSLKAYFAELGHNLKVVFWDMPKALIESLIAAIIDVGEGIKELFVALWNDFKALGGWISTAWANIKTTIGNVWVIFKEYWVNTWNSIKNFASTSVQSIKNSWESLKNSVSNIVSSIGKSIKDAVWNNGLRRVIQALANGVVNLVNKIPLVNVGYPTIPYLANGGIVDNGQLFVANEAGPELIGKYGSKTGVMNNDQIVSAVSEGVYNAVLSAMQNNNQEIVLTMDGMRLTKSIVKNINAMNRIAGGSVIG